MKIGLVLRASALSGIFVLLLTSVSVHAQDALRREELDRQAYELYQQVFSPFCAGRSLNDCPSSKAHDLKLEMRAKLEQGVTPEKILEDVFQRFGDQYRAVPQYSGFGKLVWWVPITFLLLGSLVALLVARGKRRVDVVKSSSGGISLDATAADAANPTTINEDLRRRIQSELSRLE